VLTRLIVGERAPLLVSSLLAAACWLGCAGVPRDVHEPRAYPDVKVSAASIGLEVVDSRPAPNSPNARQLLLPRDFEAAAAQRLSQLASGQGPALSVVAFVNAAGADDLVDSRGEMTRVAVKLEFEVKVQEGQVLRRAQSESQADLPRDEATPEELARLLRATSLDAFDRYWAEAKTLTALNADLAAYASRAAQ
jgi:hypothetical protein